MFANHPTVAIQQKVPALVWLGHTVDGEKIRLTSWYDFHIPWFTYFCIHPKWSAGFLPSTVCLLDCTDPLRWNRPLRFLNEDEQRSWRCERKTAVGVGMAVGIVYPSRIHVYMIYLFTYMWLEFMGNVSKDAIYGPCGYGEEKSQSKYFSPVMLVWMPLELKVHYSR